MYSTYKFFVKRAVQVLHDVTNRPMFYHLYYSVAFISHPLYCCVPTASDLWRVTNSVLKRLCSVCLLVRCSWEKTQFLCVWTAYFVICSNEVSFRLNVTLLSLCVSIFSATRKRHVFRIPGKPYEVLKLRSHCEMNSDLSLGSYPDTHAVASLLVLYLKELPEPLVPTELTDGILAAAGL